MAEQFKPISNTRDTTFIGKIKFYGRMLLDLQILTIFKDLRNELPKYSGKVLDVGCGQSPYRFLLNEERTSYFGIDIVDADKFDYSNKDITPFNGEDIPFENEFFDGVICTEVLEHVPKYQKMADEIHRVMKSDATGIITIPWSARYHYIPWDYFRYTPSSLKSIFSKFSEVEIKHRGTDIAVIANKVIVLFFRNLVPAEKWKLIFLPIWIVLLPICGLITFIAHIAIIFDLGSQEDPLGYTIYIKK